MLEMIYFERSCYVSVNILLLYFLLSWHVASECDTHVYHILLFRRHFPFSATYTTLNFTWAWRPTTAITNGNGKTTNTSMLPGLKDRAQMGSPGRDCPHGGPYIMQQAWQEFLHFSPLVFLTHVSMNQHTIIGVYRSSRRVDRRAWSAPHMWTIIRFNSAIKSCIASEPTKSAFRTLAVVAAPGTSFYGHSPHFGA